MNFSSNFPMILLGTIVATAQPWFVTAQLPSLDIAEIAKQITVRIDGAGAGSGVIVQRQGNTYTVLTNWHVVQEKGKYTVQTADGKRHQVKAIVRLPGVDLATFQFSSSQSYTVAELGDSKELTEGTTVYVAGWAQSDGSNSERAYLFVPGNISRLVQKPTDGYALVYTNPAKPGTSGGPVLSDQGLLVAINGEAIPDERITGAVDYLGIAIDTYVKLAKVDLGSGTSTELPTTTSCAILIDNQTSIPNNVSCSYANQNRTATIVQSQPILVLKTIKHLDNPMQDAFKRENQLGLVEPGTRIKIIGEIITPYILVNYTKVNILQGRLKGRTGWVATSAIVLK